MHFGLRAAVDRFVERPILIAAVIGFVPLFMEALGCSFDSSAIYTAAADPLPNAYMCNCTCSAPLASNEPIALVGDDATERSSGNMEINGAFLRLEQGNLVGLRFVDVQIPTGVTIEQAHLQFTSSATDGGALEVSIAAEAAADASPITNTDGDLSGRSPTTVAAVSWNIAAWASGESAAAERSPDLKDVVQEVVNGGGWAQGNAMLLLASHVAGGGTRKPVSTDADPAAAARLDVVYFDPLQQATVELSVCMPADLNPNKPGIGTPTDADLIGDCEARVNANVSGMAEMCGYADGCTCTVEPMGAPDPMRFFDESCNADCTGEELAGDCSNFDPEMGNKSATHVPGEDPICLVASADPPVPVPDALAGGIFGRRSRCEAEGTAEVLVEGKSPRMPAASTVLFFQGDPCPGQSCDVGLAYRSGLGPFSFDGGFLGAGDTTISEVFVSGATLPFAISLDSVGVGSFAAEETFSSGRGRRRTNRVILSDIDKRGSFTSTNGLPVDVTADWTNAQCSFQGTLLGGDVITDDDPDEDEEPIEAALTVNVNVAGPIVNQPPFADAGSDQNVECTSPTGAPVVLDGRDSFDFDDNVKFARWTEDSRTGPSVGFGLVAFTALGLDEVVEYFLTLVDGFGQASSDSVEVAVVDTTPPLLTPPADVLVECVAPEGTPAALGAPFVADACDLAPTVVNDAPALFPLGTTVVTWTATDASGNPFQATQNVVVEDTTPPEISLSVDPTTLWPPNHKLHKISASIVATDICDPNPAVELVEVLSSEPDDDIADGATTDDVQDADVGTDDRMFKVRAERQGTGDGRTYTATYQAIDGSGNSTPADAEIEVAHDKGQGTVAAAAAGASVKNGKKASKTGELTTGASASTSVTKGQKDQKVKKAKKPKKESDVGDSTTVSGASASVKAAKKGKKDKKGS